MLGNPWGCNGGACAITVMSRYCISGLWPDDAIGKACDKLYGAVSGVFVWVRQWRDRRLPWRFDEDRGGIGVQKFMDSPQFDRGLFRYVLVLKRVLKGMLCIAIYCPGKFEGINKGGGMSLDVRSNTRPTHDMFQVSQFPTNRAPGLDPSMNHLTRSRLRTRQRAIRSRTGVE